MFEGLWDHAKPSVPLPSRTDFNLEIPRHLEELYEVYLRELEEGSLERATIMDRVASRALQVGAWTSLNSLTWGSHEASQVPRVGFFLHHLSLSLHSSLSLPCQAWMRVPIPGHYCLA